MADSTEELKDLNEAQRAWVLHSEGLWRTAHAIASRWPGLDVGDVYHALRCLELSPTDRLAKGLSRGRLARGRLGAHRS